MEALRNCRMELRSGRNPLADYLVEVVATPAIHILNYFHVVELHSHTGLDSLLQSKGLVELMVVRLDGSDVMAVAAEVDTSRMELVG